LHRLIDMNLVDLAYFRTVPQLRDFSSLNPGFAAAGATLRRHAF
jgi:hypothetical protein